MSLLSLLFGCKAKPSPEKAEAEWPRFPATDNAETHVVAVPLGDGFWVKSFYITPDKQQVYVLGWRESKRAKKRKEGAEPMPGEIGHADVRVTCLAANGKAEYHKDLPKTELLEVGTFGLLEGQLMLRIGAWFWVLDPKTFEILEKIPVHESEYVAQKELTRTRDEQQADYQKEFDALYKMPSARYLNWLGGEYLIFVQGEKGKRSAWSPMSYEDELLADLKKHFPPILVEQNPTAGNRFAAELFEISDSTGKIRETGHLSAGTQLVYPNYKYRQVLQYELTLGQRKIHFSTSDKDGHALRLGFSDNLFLTTQDGAAWVVYEGVLYRID